jgi:hypothetical protein
MTWGSRTPSSATPTHRPAPGLCPIPTTSGMPSLAKRLKMAELHNCTREAQWQVTCHCCRPLDLGFLSSAPEPAGGVQRGAEDPMPETPKAAAAGEWYGGA